MTTRIAALRAALNWRQPQMAEYLGCSQPAVSNMERGQRESGSVQKLLDLLARDHDRLDLVSNNYAPPEPLEAAQ